MDMEVMLKLRPFNKAFNDTSPHRHQSLEDISLLVLPGDFVGILGESGSGKTTLLSIMEGLTSTDSGEILLDRVQGDSAMTIRSNQSVAWLGHAAKQTAMMTVQHYLQTRCSPFTSFECKEIVRQHLRQLIIECRLEHVLNKTLNQLNPEQSQFAALAYTLLGRPHLLLADNPVACITHDTRLLRCLADYTHQGGIVVMTTDNPQAMRFCTRRFVLENGRLHYAGTHVKESAEAVLLA